MQKTPTIAVALISALLSTASLAQVPRQGDVQAAGAAPGQTVGAVPAAGVPGQTVAPTGPESGPGGISTTLAVKSHSVAAGVSAGNLEGAACPAGFKMLSGACHPSYNARVTIINQFPNIPANTWRCGFKNNTTAAVSVYIYTLCGQ